MASIPNMSSARMSLKQIKIASLVTAVLALWVLPPVASAKPVKTKDLPNLQVPQGGSATLNLSEYFESNNGGTLGYILDTGHLSVDTSLVTATIGGSAHPHQSSYQTGPILTVASTGGMGANKISIDVTDKVPGGSAAQHFIYAQLMDITIVAATPAPPLAGTFGFPADAPATLSVPEDAAVNDAVGTIVVIDYAGTVAYSLSDTSPSSGDAAFFAVDSGTGAITVKQPLDYEAKNSYEVTLTATDTSDNTKTDTHDLTIAVTNVQEPPAKPATPTVINITDTEAEVVWYCCATTSDPATSFKVRFRREDHWWWTTLIGGSVAPQFGRFTLRAGSMKPGYQYEVQVAGVNKFSPTNLGVGEWSDSAFYRTLTNTVEFPANAAATLSVENDASVNDVAGTVAIRPYAGTVAYSLSDTIPTSGDADFFAVDSSGAITVKKALAQNKTSYALTLRATDSIDTTKFDTHPLTVIVVMYPPAKPATPAVNTILVTGATITWTAPPVTASADPATSYVVRYKPTGTNFWTESDPLPNPTYDLTGLVSGGQYDVVVVAINGSTINNGRSADSNSTTFTTALGAPTLAQDASNKLKVTWPTGARTADSYRVRYSTNDGTSWTTFAATTVSSTLSVPFGIYIAQVAAVYGGVTGAWSASSASQALAPKLDKPDAKQRVRDLGFAGTFRNKLIDVSWTDNYMHPQNINVEYRVRYSNDNGLNWKLEFSPTDETSDQVGDISFGETYIVQVAVLYGTAVGPWSDSSDPVTIFRDVTPPKLDAPTVSVVNDQFVVVAWVDTNTPPADTRSRVSGSLPRPRHHRLDGVAPHNGQNADSGYFEGGNLQRGGGGTLQLG